MDSTNNSNTLYYAILKATRTSADPERFIIGYRSEQSLHEFLAASCIVASGYGSREEASHDCEIQALSLAA